MFHLESVRGNVIMHDSKKEAHRSFGLGHLVCFSIILFFIIVVCICVGSVMIPFKDTLHVLMNALTGASQEEVKMASNIILPIRLPRVLCVMFVGAGLSLSGAAMQGLLKNPLADGSTLGISSGASLGAVIAMAFGLVIPGMPFGSTTIMAILFSFLSLVIILSLAYHLDSSLSTNTIILIGVIFSMFASSFSSLIITFAGEKLKTITFWTMGSLQGSGYKDALLLGITLFVCGGVLLSIAQELNAFAIGEDNARNIGVDVKKIKLTVLITVSLLIGVSVSISGCIGFVGLVTPHMFRRYTGPNHKVLLPVAMFGGAYFLLLADLISRTIASPRELPIGVVTSLVGAISFIYIFYNTRKG